MAGVLFFMDGRGIRPALFDLGQRLANAGHYVLLPDLLYRAGAYQAPGPNAFTADPEFASIGPRSTSRA